MMKMTDENRDWKVEAPILAALSRSNPYRVPDNYFNNLTAQLHSFTFLKNLSSEANTGFIVPDNYFEALTEQITDKIVFEKLKADPASTGFKTPADYFDKLQHRILSQTVQERSSSKRLRLWNNEWIKYASAACFVLLVASGLYFKQQQVIKTDRYAEMTSDAILYNIDESVIVEHLKEGQTATNTVSQTEMENYILNHYSARDLSNNL